MDAQRLAMPIPDVSQTRAISSETIRHLAVLSAVAILNGGGSSSNATATVRASATSLAALATHIDKYGGLWRLGRSRVK